MSDSVNPSIEAIKNFRIGKDTLGTDGENIYVVGLWGRTFRVINSALDIYGFEDPDRDLFDDCKFEKVDKTIQNLIKNLRGEAHSVDKIQLQEKLDKLRIHKFEKDERRFGLETASDKAIKLGYLIGRSERGELEIMPLPEIDDDDDDDDDVSMTVEELDALLPLAPSSRTAATEVPDGLLVEKLTEKGTVIEVAPGMSQVKYSGSELREFLGDESLGPYHQCVVVTSIDLNQYELDVIGGQTNGVSCADAAHAIGEESAGALINGGFFSINGWFGLSHGSPLGMLKTELEDNTTLFRGQEASEVYEIPKILSRQIEGRSITSEISTITRTPKSYRDTYGVLMIGDREVKLRKQTELDSDPRLTETARRCISSSPILIQEGQRTFTAEKQQEDRFKFEFIYKMFGRADNACPPGSLYHADQPNPRSAIGLRSDNTCFMVTVKGRGEDSSTGMSLAQMSALMKKLGAGEALCLDGGGSSIQGFKNPRQDAIFQKSSPRSGSYPVGSFIIAKQKRTQ